MKNKRKADIKENDLLKIDSALLAVLLKDMTTGHNILWCTDNYEKYGKEYSADREIKIELITGKNDGIIKPRTEKSKEEQLHRIKQKGEVFTPAWICNYMINAIDGAMAGNKEIFNIENEPEKSWISTKGKIKFPASDKPNLRIQTWQKYVKTTALEITCGEAPFLTSRYDAVTGQSIPVPDRIGLLDRKLRLVNENSNTPEEWFFWAREALRSVYGYEWQGDSLLIARANLLFTFLENFDYVFHLPPPPSDILAEYAEIISYNIWQMDGLKFVIPQTCHSEIITEGDLFEQKTVIKECPGCKHKDPQRHNGIYCKIMDWEKNEFFKFADMLKGSKLRV